MRGTGAAARAVILAAAVCAVLCVRSALPPGGTGVPWGTVGLLTGLYLACELPARRPFFGSSVPISAGSFFPLLLAAAFLLPPAAAALVVIPGSLAGRVENPPVAARRFWRTAQLVITVWVASTVHGLLGGGATLGGPGPGLLPDFPYAVLPACVAALAFSLVLTAYRVPRAAAARPDRPRGQRIRRPVRGRSQRPAPRPGTAPARHRPRLPAGGGRIACEGPGPGRSDPRPAWVTHG